MVEAPGKPSPTSTRGPLESEHKIYPNSVTHDLNIPAALELNSITLFDLRRRVVLESRVDAAGQVTVSDLPRGLRCIAEKQSGRRLPPTTGKTVIDRTYSAPAPRRQDQG
jgi:hypothetical protein